MLIDIDKMTDHTTRGKPLGFAGFGTNTPAARRLADLGLVGGGIAMSAGKYLLTRNGKEKPYHHMIVIVLGGKLRIDTPHDDFIANVGDLIHIPSWTPRRIELVEGDVYEELYFRCKAEPPSRELWTEKLVVRPSSEYVAIQRAVEGLSEELGKGDTGRDTASLYADLLGRLLIREMSSHRSDAITPAWHGLRNVIDEIRCDPSADWNVQRLCDILHVSRTQLFRIFRQAFGKSPLQYVAEVRMNHARQLLMTTDLPLDIIAGEIGYSNAYSFSNALMKYTGTRPGALRRSLLGV